MKEVQIDAKQRPIGRVASEVAMILNGKTDVEYQPNKISDVVVTVSNLELIKIESSKKSNKYYRHSGYPGALKTKTLGELFETNPQKFFLMMVKRMLPDNRLRKGKLKKIKFI